MGIIEHLETSSPSLFSPIEFLHGNIFGDEKSLIGEARWGKNQVELELPTLLSLVRTGVCQSIKGNVV